MFVTRLEKDRAQFHGCAYHTLSKESTLKEAGILAWLKHTSQSSKELDVHSMLLGIFGFHS